MNHREELIKKIEVKESQLHKLEEESRDWNSEKLENSTNDAIKSFNRIIT